MTGILLHLSELMLPLINFFIRDRRIYVRKCVYSIVIIAIFSNLPWMFSTSFREAAQKIYIPTNSKCPVQGDPCPLGKWKFLLGKNEYARNVQKRKNMNTRHFQNCFVRVSPNTYSFLKIFRFFLHNIYFLKNHPFRVFPPGEPRLHQLGEVRH